MAPSSVALEEKTDSFLLSFLEPQWGHAVPFHRLERSRISLSLLQWLQ
jgi:hypothetical protein